MIDYQIRLINFPNIQTREAGAENNDGRYMIFIETSLSKEA